MSGAETATELIVKWPGGKETRTKIPAGAREVLVNETSQLKP
jgi:hypothetical protein